MKDKNRTTATSNVPNDPNPEGTGDAVCNLAMLVGMCDARGILAGDEQRQCVIDSIYALADAAGVPRSVTETAFCVNRMTGAANG